VNVQAKRPLGPAASRPTTGATLDSLELAREKHIA
jgi:hypothetical protein